MLFYLVKLHNEDLSYSAYVYGFFFLSSALQKKPEDINRRSADMWSFAVLLWELVTREVPFADLSHMEIGMKVSWHSIYLPIGFNIALQTRAAFLLNTAPI